MTVNKLAVKIVMHDNSKPSSNNQHVLHQHYQLGRHKVQGSNNGQVT